jgi:hypothetical protein
MSQPRTRDTPFEKWPRKRHRPRRVWRVAIAAAVLAMVYAALFWFLRNPSFESYTLPTTYLASSERLRGDVAALAAIKPSRGIANPAALELAVEHIEAEFGKSGCALERHTFQYAGRPHHNIICSFGPRDGERVLLGAHYDVFQHSEPAQPGFAEEIGKHMPGADDNASGVAGLLEIARMVASERPALSRRLDLVAFALEEETEWADRTLLRSNIGSHEYASRLRADGVEVKLMVSVEMIGYFGDGLFSQGYPAVLAPLLYLIYPTRADFIGVIGGAWDRAQVARVRYLMTVRPDLPVYSINAPAFVPGIDRSDHKHFWTQGYPAVMVTDTADFRNANYHRSSDTPETLDYAKMAGVVEGLYRVATAY